MMHSLAIDDDYQVMIDQLFKIMDGIGTDIHNQLQLLINQRLKSPRRGLMSLFKKNPKPQDNLKQGSFMSGFGSGQVIHTRDREGNPMTVQMAD